MTFSFGDVVLVSFPFTDQRGTKKRPAVVVSSSAYNREKLDVILMAITSQLPATPALGNCLITDWQAASLLKPSAVKPIFASFEQNLIIKRLGALEIADQDALRGVFAKILG